VLQVRSQSTLRAERTCPDTASFVTVVLGRSRSIRGVASTSDGIEYARRLHEDVLQWYRSAETKSQIILTLDGVFLGFLAGPLLSGGSEVTGILDSFGSDTWIFLALMALSLAFSILSAVLCLISRTYSKAELNRFFAELMMDPDKPETYRPQGMWFFQHVAGLNKGAFEQRLLQAEPNLEISALASQIYVLGGNVVKKHRWANRGFFFTGSTLLLFLATAVSLVLHARG
jgi:hypothetical protein